MFLLNILWSLLVDGKCLSMRLRNFLPTLVLTFFAVWWVESGNTAMTLASVRREILERFSVLIREVRAEVAAVEGLLGMVKLLLGKLGRRRIVLIGVC